MMILVRFLLLISSELNRHEITAQEYHNSKTNDGIVYFFFLFSYLSALKFMFFVCFLSNKKPIYNIKEFHMFDFDHLNRAFVSISQLKIKIKKVIRFIFLAILPFIDIYIVISNKYIIKINSHKLPIVYIRNVLEIK